LITAFHAREQASVSQRRNKIRIGATGTIVILANGTRLLGSARNKANRKESKPKNKIPAMNTSA